jgi:hypothetical protein
MSKHRDLTDLGSVAGSCVDAHVLRSLLPTSESWDPDAVADGGGADDADADGMDSGMDGDADPGLSLSSPDGEGRPEVGGNCEAPGVLKMITKWVCRVIVGGEEVRKNWRVSG